MIKTPSGQYINPDDISCAYLELFPYKHKETGQLYKDYDLPVYMESQWFKGFAIEVTLKSQKDKLTASYAYETKEQAQAELDKMMGNTSLTNNTNILDLIKEDYFEIRKSNNNAESITLGLERLELNNYRATLMDDTNNPKFKDTTYISLYKAIEDFNNIELKDI